MQSTSICTDNTPASVTTQPPPPSITPNDRIWANLLNEAFIGDVVACLSIKEALALDESSNQQWHKVTNTMPVLPETFCFCLTFTYSSCYCSLPGGDRNTIHKDAR